MARFALMLKERQLLEDFVARTPVGKEHDRAQALLCLDQGLSVEQVARLFNVSQPTVYNWVKRFEERGSTDIRGRLADAPRSGRPRSTNVLIEPLASEDKYRRELEKLIVRAPVGKEHGRAQALLWLAKGHSVDEIAHLFRVSRPTVYNWVRRIANRPVREMETQLADSPRSGRPCSRRRNETAPEGTTCDSRRDPQG